MNYFGFGEIGQIVLGTWHYGLLNILDHTIIILNTSMNKSVVEPAKKILVVDDDPEVREGITDILEAEGFLVFTSGDVADALAQAEEFQPDLILCDVIMPIMSGYDLLEKCKQNPNLALVPFIFLTAHADKEIWRHSMELGADDYLTKPIDRKDLLGAIASRLRKHSFFNAVSSHKLETLRRSITLSLPHELRTPLSGILGMAEILVAEAPNLSPTEIAKIGQDILTCGERLNRLIQNFLLYAELEANPTQGSPCTALTPIKELTSSIAQKCARLANRPQDLHLQLTDAVVTIPPTRWQKIVEEIIDNAFRYSVAGQPVFVQSGFAGNLFVLQIRDCGRGMTAEQISNLGAYMQFDRRIYEQQGTGLGLTLAKRLVEFYGGMLTIDSTPLVGTTVTLQFQVIQE